MQVNTPMLAAGLGGGAVAAYLLLRKPVQDKLLYGEYAEDPDFADFSPSEWSFSEDEMLEEGEYGWWWATKRGKARRRDRKLRRASRRTNRYNKCVEKKGADHKKCQLILKYAEKSVKRAQVLDDKLAAKGRTGQARFTPSGFATVSAVAVAPEESYAPDESSYEQSQMELVGPASDIPYETYTQDTSGGGIPPALMALGGVAVLGIGGTVIFMLAKPKKKRRRKKRPTKQVAAA